MLRGLCSGCSLEIVCDMVTVVIEVVTFAITGAILHSNCCVGDFFKSSVSSQCPELSGWCHRQLGVSPTRAVWGEQPVFPMALPVSQFVSNEELGVLTRSTCSPLADQAKRH